MTRLGGVQTFYQRVKIGGFSIIQAVALHIMMHAFLATGHRQQLAVQADIPLPVKSRLGESPIEGQPVSVTLGIGQCPVNIENQCLECHEIVHKIQSNYVITATRVAASILFGCGPGAFLI